MSDFIGFQKALIAVRELFKCIGFLPNYAVVDWGAFHFQSGEYLVKINGTSRIALNDTVTTETLQAHQLHAMQKKTKTKQYTHLPTLCPVKKVNP